jgi:hypothetical protein
MWEQLFVGYLIVGAGIYRWQSYIAKLTAFIRKTVKNHPGVIPERQPDKLPFVEQRWMWFSICGAIEEWLVWRSPPECQARVPSKQSDFWW